MTPCKTNAALGVGAKVFGKDNLCHYLERGRF